MICLQCNKEFVSTSNRQIYCSKKCYKKSDKTKEKIRKYEQSDKGMETKKKYAQKRRKKQGHKICLQCKKEFLPLKSHKNYCSSKCYTKSDKYKELDSKRNQLPKRKEYRKKLAQTFESKQRNLAYQRSDKFKSYNRKRQKEKRISDPVWRLVVNMRARLLAFVKASNVKKSNKTFVMVGCTPEFLKKHLEKQFYNRKITNEPMTWKNHSLRGWHVDHIKPLDKALTSEDLEKLSHYTNLQPLWSEDNIRKSNKII